ncbi:MAG: hypothetical protein SFU83_09580 [Meiothermus sp.]|nr:hypothetical protein [Meiothermus sp.]
MDIAVFASIFAVGGVVFSQFEEGTPKWRRLAKFALTMSLVALVGQTLGRVWVYAGLGLLALAVLYIHAVWLPGKGINGWTAEPRERYYALRGWDWKK